MNLFIGWNAWSVLEYLMTGEDIQNTYWRFKDDYYKGFTPTWLAKPFKMYKDQKVDKVFAPSSLTQRDYDFIKSLRVDDVYYLEEGEYDYRKYGEEDAHFFVPFYTMNPDKIANPEKFPEIRKLELTVQVTNKFLNMYDAWLPSNDYDVILYTDPLEADCKISNVKEIVVSYMEKYHPNEKILVKAHPRDNVRWDWDVCSHRIPAQLLLNRDVTHVFMYETTVIRYLDSLKRKEMIDFGHAAKINA